MRRVQDKVAVVTGGASGIGKAIAKRLLDEGAKVTITDMQIALGREVAETLNCDFLEQNVTDEQRWREVMQAVEEKHGQVDVLVNNAGIVGPKATPNPENTPLSEWKKINEVNLDGVFLGCKSAIGAMRKTGAGSIVNIASIAGMMATPYATAYGASKAAVRQLTKSVAMHCAVEGLKIRCNSVHPGDVLTPMRERAFEEDALQYGMSKEELIGLTRSNIPLGDLIDPVDVANAVLFLASDESRCITGAPFLVDGGVLNCESFSLWRQQ